MGVGGQRHVPAVSLPKNSWYALYTMLGGPQGPSRLVRKILPLPAFEPRTVQPVASPYAD
jgi:hypothetical protein